MSDASAPSPAFVRTILASRVGDAMGTPTENLTPTQIQERFGWVTQFSGDGTDDSLMATILAEALIATGGSAGPDEWAAGILAHRTEILGKSDKFFPSVLHLLEKLASGYRPADVAAGNMPSSSSAMCIWPVGLLHAGDPDAAAHHAQDLGALIHTGLADHCVDAASMIAAAVAAAQSPGADIDDCVTAALDAPRPDSGSLMRRAAEEAVTLAADSPDYARFREQYQLRFNRPIFCDSLETVPAALALSLLARGDVRTAVEYGANFGRDTDTIAAMAGAICGALAAALPQDWLDQLGAPARHSAERLAGRLHATALSYTEVRAGRAARTLRVLREG
ncbi:MULTISPECIES: ADP-ribosylglycohydrolase family protein [Microbacterium]|uniref:ADP-ribosylglycohydrolase family protein n=1 Tax=Microbacterium TaxID=33882 RepID=UPI00146E5504|nr:MULTISPECIES: ADP-ribosylglycohydrolase family protein [Microbacterium]